MPTDDEGCSDFEEEEGEAAQDELPLLCGKRIGGQLGCVLLFGHPGAHDCGSSRRIWRPSVRHEVAIGAGRDWHSRAAEPAKAPAGDFLLCAETMGDSFEGGHAIARAGQQFLPMTENGIQCEPALAAAADIPQLLAAALSPLHLPYLLHCRVIFPLSALACLQYTPC